MNYIVAVILGIVLMLLYQKYQKNEVLAENQKTKELIDNLQKQVEANNAVVKTEEEKQTVINKELEDAKTNKLDIDAMVEFLNNRKR